MKLTSSALKHIIDEEIRQLKTDDAIFKTQDMPGIQPTRDIPGDVDDSMVHKMHAKKSSYMSKPQIYKIAKYADKIYDMIEDDQELPDWMESHIAQIAQMIGSVYHSLDHKHNMIEK